MHHYFSLLRKWTFGLHCISSICSSMLLLLVAHCCTLLPLLQFRKKNWIGSVKKFLFFFLFPPSLCDLIVCSFFSFFLVCAAGKQHNILVPRNQKLVYTEVLYTNLQSWILAIRQLLNILHIGIAYVFKILSVFLKLSNLHVIKVVLEFTTKLPDQT